MTVLLLVVASVVGVSHFWTEHAHSSAAKPAVAEAGRTDSKPRRQATVIPRVAWKPGQPWPGKWIKYPADELLPKGLAIEVTGGVVTGVIDENPDRRARDILGSRYVEGDLDATEITPPLWRFIDLEMPKPDGSITKLSVGRPLWWLQRTGARVGATIDLGMQEIGVSGAAKVLHIGRCTEDSRDSGPDQNLVTGRIEHHNAIVYDLVFNSEVAEPLGVTANHPIFSSDRADWVPAGELRIGEKVRTVDGVAELTAKSRRPGRHTVYNLEVHRSHIYHVSQFGVLAHNNNIVDCTKMPVYRGGTSTVARPIDMKIDKTTGLVKPGYGLSVNAVKDGLERFGGARRVVSIPEGLQIIQQGANPNHYVISPKAPMTPQQFQELLDLVIFE